MSYIAAYRASYAPRLIQAGSERRLAENELAQISLWNAAQILTAQTSGLSVECRIVAGRSSRDQAETSSLMLLVGDPRGVGKDEAQQHLRALERLLPMEYGWVRLDPTRSDAFGPDGESSVGWRVSRVVRRVEFATLPRMTSVLWSGIQDGATSAARGLPKGDGSNLENESGVEPAPGLGETAWALGTGLHSSLRSLPNSRSHNVVRDLRGPRSLCLPLLGRFSQYLRTTRRLFQEMEQSTPVVVSIAIHPIDPGSLRIDRAIATGWRRFLEPFASAIANAGFAEYGAVQATFERYWLPDKYLAYVSIRVAARAESQSIGVAQHLCSRLGGMRGFEVIPPRRPDGNSLLLLGDPSVDIPSEAWSESEIANSRSFWHERLLEADVRKPSRAQYIDFLTRFPHIYTVDEVEQLMRLPVADEEGLPRLETRMVPPFSTPTLRYAPVVEENGTVSQPEKDRVRIGMVRTSPVMSSGSAWQDPGNYHWHSIKVSDLTRHALIVGSTGSGKTMTTLFILKELHRLGIPFLVIEPVKTEYQTKLAPHSAVRRYHLEGNRFGSFKDFLAFDPMRLQEGVTVARHTSYLKSCFEAAFPMEPWMALILEAGIRSYYLDIAPNGGCELSLFSEGGPSVHVDRKVRGIYPSLSTFARYFCGYESEGPSYIDRAFTAGSVTQLETRDMFRRRFDNLMRGVLGRASVYADHCYRASQGQSYECFSSSLQRNTIIELDAVPDPEQKALITAFLMTFLFERRQAEDVARRAGQASDTSTLRHVLVLEEAHRLLANYSGGRSNNQTGLDARAKAVSIFVDMLAEIRALGQGIIIVEQIPTKIVPDAIKNTNLKVMLRITAADDREYLGSAMNFTDEQKRFVTGLKAKPGDSIQFVAFEEGIEQPVLLSLPLPETQKSPAGRSWLFDEFFDS